MLLRRRCLEELDLISMDHLSHSTCWRLTYSNTTAEQLEMTTPVFTRKGEPSGKKMDMTAPVITKKSADKNQWKMSFVMPSKYGSDLPLPKDPSVTIKEVPSKIVAVAAFSGLGSKSCKITTHKSHYVIVFMSMSIKRTWVFKMGVNDPASILTTQKDARPPIRITRASNLPKPLPKCRC